MAGPESAVDVASLIRHATAHLTSAGVGSPRVDAELLLADVLGVGRSVLLTRRTVSAAEAAEFQAVLRRRSAREPLQHITGRAPFRHLDLAVGPGVFVPRPETELLVDLVADELRAAATVVDLCSGSGALALSVAQEFGPARVVAVERSSEASAWLRRNADERAAAGDRPIGIVLADVGSPDLLADLRGAVDVLTCNPPYVPARVRGELDPEVGFDPEDAVFSGDDGLELLPAVVSAAARLLRSGGVVALEHDDSHQESVLSLFDDDWAEVRGHRDLADRPRFVTARRR